MKSIFKVLACIALLAVLVPTVSNAQTEDTRTVMKSFVDSIQQNNDKITINTVDQKRNIAEGNEEGYSPVNVFGRSIAGIQATATDIWDRADATPTQQIWTTWTDAELFNIASTSAGDTSAGTGTRTIKVTGLTDWDSGAVTELVSMNGTSNVSTDQSYVMIHEMEVETVGTSSASPNIGTITATGATSLKVGAEINIGEGKTNMAILGVPSSQKLYINEWFGGIDKATGTWIDYTIIANTTPDTGTETAGFITKAKAGVQIAGMSTASWPFNPSKVIAGPAIVKIQGISSTADTEGNAGLNGYLADNNNNSPNNLLAGGVNAGKKLQDTHGRFLLHDSN
jgi:hypothetical protein